MDAASRETGQFGFLNLPTEIRLQIFQYLFEESKLSCGTPHIGRPSCGCNICSCEFPWHIAYTCRKLREEALPMLLAVTTLEVANSLDRVSHLPPSFQSLITRAVVLDSKRFVFQSSQLEKLQSLQILELRNITVWCKFYDEVFLESDAADGAMYDMALFNLRRINRLLHVYCYSPRPFNMLLCCQYVVNSLSDETIHAVVDVDDRRIVHKTRGPPMKEFHSCTHCGVKTQLDGLHCNDESSLGAGTTIITFSTFYLFHLASSTVPSLSPSIFDSTAPRSSNLSICLSPRIMTTIKTASLSEDEPLVLSGCFLELPTEIRIMICRFYFSGLRIFYKDSENKESVLFLQLFKPATVGQVAIVCVNKFIRNEALSTLVSVAVLCFPKHASRDDPLTRIKEKCLLRLIRHIEIDVDRFPYVNRKYLTSPGTMRIIGPYVWHHRFLYDTGPAPKMSDLMRRKTKSWEWKEYQYRHLSKEEGWLLEFAHRTSEPGLFTYVDRVYDKTGATTENYYGVTGGRHHF